MSDIVLAYVAAAVFILAIGSVLASDETSEPLRLPRTARPWAARAALAAPIWPVVILALAVAGLIWWIRWLIRTARRSTT